MDKKSEREQLFAKAIAHQKNGKTNFAKILAQECLNKLQGVQSETDAATSEVSITVHGQTVLLPEYLHTETALRDFRAAGIMV